MAKRFVDTELWKKQWFQDLTPVNKLLVKYIFENCDCAGIWEANFKLASFIIGEPVTIDDIRYINNSCKNLFEVIEEDKIFVIDFIKFQYGTLSENCKPHKPVIEKLKKHNLYERVLKGFPKGIETLEEKEKEKEQYNNNITEQIILGDEYQNVCLTKEQYGKLLSLCASEKLLNELVNSFSVNIEVGKERPYKADTPNAHYERLKAYYKNRMMYPDKYRVQSVKTEENTGIKQTDKLVKQWEKEAQEAKENPADLTNIRNLANKIRRGENGNEERNSA